MERSEIRRNGWMGRTRRTLLVSGSTFVVGVVLAACGGEGEAGKGEVDLKNHPPIKLTTNIMDKGNPTWPAFEAADKAIKGKYPWLTMEYLGGANSSFDGMTKAVADAAAGSLPDMIYAQGSQIQFYISKKTVLPISSYLSKDKAFDIADFPKVAIDMYSRSGQVFAIPYDHGPQMLWYNAELFKKRGVTPPTDKWTWDDVLEAAKKITDPAQNQWGILDGGPNAGWSMAAYLGPWGGEWVDDSETKTGIASAPSLQAMQYWTDLFFKYKVNAVPGSFQGSIDEMFLQGKVGMRLGGPWTYRGWIGKLNFEAPIANWPLGSSGKRISGSMGSGYPISATTKYRDETWAYMSELVGKDPERSILWQFVKTGLGTPIRFSAMKEFEKSKFAPPNVAIVAPAEKYAALGRPISPAKFDVDKIFTEERAALLKQEVGAKEFVDKVASRVAPILEKNKGWDKAN